MFKISESLLYIFGNCQGNKLSCSAEEDFGFTGTLILIVILWGNVNSVRFIFKWFVFVANGSSRNITITTFWWRLHLAVVWFECDTHKIQIMSENLIWELKMIKILSTAVTTLHHVHNSCRPQRFTSIHWILFKMIQTQLYKPQIGGRNANNKCCHFNTSTHFKLMETNVSENK